MATKRILYIDDDRDLQDIVRRFLEKHGFEVKTAPDPAMATKLLAEIATFDLILMDVMMPGVGGLDACRLLKSSKASKAKPIVLVSALGKPADLERGKAAGADRYLVKPFDLNVLLSTIRELAR